MAKCFRHGGYGSCEDCDIARQKLTARVEELEARVKDHHIGIGIGRSCSACATYTPARHAKAALAARKGGA